jgi:hypothetical protein
MPFLPKNINKNKPIAEFMLKLKDKPIEERIKILNAMDKSESAHSRLNDDGYCEHLFAII